MTTQSKLNLLGRFALLFAITSGLLRAYGQTVVSPALPTIPGAVYAVTNYGAIGDGISTNTSAIQAAINDASTLTSGGTIEFPYVDGSANVYLSGPIKLKNKMNLQVDAGVTLRMLPYSIWTNIATGNFISAGSAPSDVEISGGGTIDGQANTSGWWNGMSTSSRPYLINLSHGTRIWIHDVTLTRPPKMHIVIGSSASSDITIEHITIATDSGDSHNTDGIDLTGHNELVRDSNISCGDDNIAITSTSYDILVTNCNFGTGHGMSFGSDTGPGGISNVTVINCTFDKTDNGVRIKSDNTSGGPVEDIHYINLSMTNVNNGAVVIYGYYPSASPNNTSISAASAQPVTPVTGDTPVWHDIYFSNLTATVAGNATAGILWGRTEMPLTNIVFDHVHITAANTFNIFNAQQVKFLDSSITNTSGSARTYTIWNSGVIVSNSVPATNRVTFDGQYGNTNDSLALYYAPAAINNLDAFGANPLTLGGCVLTNATSLIFNNDTVNFALGTNNTSIAVGGSLNLNATINITDGPGFAATNYTLFTYTGNLTSQPVLGATPADFSGYTYRLDTNTAKQVNLVVTAPAPTFGNIRILSNSGGGGNVGFVMSGTGGGANGTYSVLMSTNLALNEWVPLASNQFDAGGNFIFTNLVPSNAPQEFFRLQVP